VNFHYGLQINESGWQVLRLMHETGSAAGLGAMSRPTGLRPRCTELATDLDKKCAIN
jgi:hypothetical protein